MRHYDFLHEAWTIISKNSFASVFFLKLYRAGLSTRTTQNWYHHKLCPNTISWDIMVIRFLLNVFLNNNYNLWWGGFFFFSFLNTIFGIQDKFFSIKGSCLKIRVKIHFVDIISITELSRLFKCSFTSSLTNKTLSYFLCIVEMSSIVMIFLSYHLPLLNEIH